MLSRSSQSQIGSKASSTTWVPLKALPDVEIIEIEPIVAEFLHGQRLSSIKIAASTRTVCSKLTFCPRHSGVRERKRKIETQLHQLTAISRLG
jgi:hypothetical protein